MRATMRGTQEHTCWKLFKDDELSNCNDTVTKNPNIPDCFPFRQWQTQSHRNWLACKASMPKQPHFCGNSCLRSPFSRTYLIAGKSLGRKGKEKLQAKKEIVWACSFVLRESKLVSLRPIQSLEEELGHLCTRTESCTLKTTPLLNFSICN